MRKIKKVFSLLLMISQAVAVMNVRAWTGEDIISANIIADSGFDSTTGTVFSNGNVDVDPDADGRYGNVVRVERGKYLKVNDGGQKLYNIIMKNSSIFVEFDYYITVECADLRCELRAIANNEITKAAQAKYWKGFEYGSDIAPNQWNHMFAELDTNALKQYYNSIGTLNQNPTSAYFYIGGLSEGTLYIDNVNIREKDAEDIIVPLQIPMIKYADNFVEDSGVLGPAGETDGVYKGLVNVAAGSSSLTGVLDVNGFAFNEGKYRISFWFMEDKNNSDQMTRMWRPIIGSSNAGTTIKSVDGSWIYYSSTADATPLGEWKYLEMDFKVTNSNDYKQLLASNSFIKLWWQRASENYESKNIDGDFYIYMYDFNLFKYPEADMTTLENISPGVGELIPTYFKNIELRYSLPVSASSVLPENIIINGIIQSKHTINISVDNETITLSKPVGFAPNCDYVVSVKGLKDIWGRDITDDCEATFKTKDYSDITFLGSFVNTQQVDFDNASMLKFGLTNNYGEALNLNIIIIGFNKNAVKKVFPSAVFNVPDGEYRETKINVENLGLYDSVFVYAWNINDAAITAFSKPLRLK